MSTGTLVVSQSADDAYEIESSGNVYDTSDDIAVLSYTSSSLRYWGGYRYTGTLPSQGSTINTCYAQFYVGSATYDDINCVLYFQDAASGISFTAGGATFDISGRARTTNNASWVANSLGTGWQNSPSLVDALQELVDAYTLTSIVLIAVPNQDAYKYFKGRAWDYDDNSLAPKLYIDWTEPAGATAQAVGGGTVTPVGTLATKAKYFMAMGGGSIVPTGALATAATWRESVGAGVITPTGALKKLIRKGVGGGAVAITSALDAFLWRKHTWFFRMLQRK